MQITTCQNIENNFENYLRDKLLHKKIKDQKNRYHNIEINFEKGTKDS